MSQKINCPVCHKQLLPKNLSKHELTQTHIKYQNLVDRGVRFKIFQLTNGHQVWEKFLPHIDTYTYTEIDQNGEIVFESH
jgi:hypothetical protein